MNKSDVIAWLREQPDSTFFEVVYEGGSGRGPDEHDRDWHEAHIVAGYAVRDKTDDAQENPWTVELVALPRQSDVLRADSEALLCQAGRHCGQELTSWAKEIRCPLCGADAYAS
jgi:hypothetical protein